MLDQLMAAHTGMVRSVVARIVTNEADAEEVVQDVWMRVWVGLETFRGHSAPRTWIYRIAFNVAISRYRNLMRPSALPKREPLDGYDAPTGSPSPEREAIAKQQVIRMHAAALDYLTFEQFEALTLYLQGYTIRDAAKELGIIEQTYKTRLGRARARLREVMV